MPKKNIENLVNQITNQTLLEEVSRLNKILYLSDAPCFINGYCASDKNTFDKVVQYISEKTKIPNIINCSFTQGENLTDLIFELQKNSKKEDYLVKVTGFHLIKNLSAHGYDQTIQQTCGDEIKKLNLENPKKIIIVTNIDPNEKNYDYSVRDACSSEFRSFLYEF